MSSTKQDIPSEEIMPNLIKVLDLIVMNIKPEGKKNMKPHRDAYSLAASESNQAKQPKSVAKQCVTLTNKCLCSRRYKEAAKLLWILCQDKSVFEMFIFKASLIVLENLDCDDKDEVMWRFMSEVQNLELVNKKEVQLEFIIRSLIHNIPDVKERSQALIGMKRKNYLRKNPLLDPILEAYCAMLEFLKTTDFHTATASQAERSADETILKFKSIIESPGDWDIFLLKLIEMFYMSDRVQEVEEVLLKYVHCNPDNLNAHIYLCLYLNECKPDSEKLIEHLEIISKMSPSDESVLLLVEKLDKSNKKLPKCIKLIFMFLDYPSNGKNLNAWRMLADFVRRAAKAQNQRALAAFQSCWVTRRRSWQWMYYNPLQVTDLKDGDKELVECKVQVLSYFNLEHEYIAEVNKKFPAILDLLKVPNYKKR